MLKGLSDHERQFGWQTDGAPQVDLSTHVRARPEQWLLIPPSILRCTALAESLEQEQGD